MMQYWKGFRNSGLFLRMRKKIQPADLPVSETGRFRGRTAANARHPIRSLKISRFRCMGDIRFQMRSVLFP